MAGADHAVARGDDDGDGTVAAGQSHGACGAGAPIWSAISRRPGFFVRDCQQCFPYWAVESRFPEVKFHIEFGELAGEISVGRTAPENAPGSGVQCVRLGSYVC